MDALRAYEETSDTIVSDVQISFDKQISDELKHHSVRYKEQIYIKYSTAIRGASFSILVLEQ